MERERGSHEEFGGGPSGPDAFSPHHGSAGSVTICHGPYSEQLPVAGMSVSEIRVRYADRFDVHPLSQAVIDGQEVDDGTVLQTGQMLTFMRRAGEKGALAGAA